MLRSTVAALVVPLALGACATPSGDSAAAHEEKEYRTGSNIPVRDRSMAGDAKTLDPGSIERERELDRMRDIGRRSISGTK
jgi:hypothetical protein